MAAIIGSVMGAGVAHADPMVFYFQNDAPHWIQLYLADQTAGVAWPGNGEAFDLNKDGVETIAISCTVGHQICYGAWYKGNRSVSWGSGYMARGRCSNCCYTCTSGAEVHVSKFVE